MSAIEAPASEKALNYWLTLAERLGEPTDPKPVGWKQCSDQIDEMLARIPATDSQLRLAAKLISDIVPGKAVPNGASTKMVGDLIKNFSARAPLAKHLQRCRDLEMSIGVDNPNAPRTMEKLYAREQYVRNLVEGDDLVGQLIDQRDAVKEQWGLVELEVNLTGTEYTDEDAVPESASTSVKTNGRKGR